MFTYYLLARGHHRCRRRLASTAARAAQSSGKIQFEGPSRVCLYGSTAGRPWRYAEPVGDHLPAG